LAAEVEGVRQGAERLKTAASNLGATCAGISVNVAPPTRFNRLLDMTDNKADALFLLTAEVLAHLFRKFDGEPIIITMDKQGGRDYYGPLLARAFPDMHLAVEKESPGESRYTLTGNGRVVRLSIARGGEDRSLAVALASMTAKYVRELFMRQLNAFFSRLLPDLRPTAGYWVDAGRFLQETAEVARSLDIPDSAWVRSR
jgi:ribonuclease HIII